MGAILGGLLGILILTEDVGPKDNEYLPFIQPTYSFDYKYGTFDNDGEII